MLQLWKARKAYVEQSTVVDFALLKFCLCAVGVVIGLCVPKRKKAKAGLMATGVFAVAYIPLMRKFFRVADELAEDEAF